MKRRALMVRALLALLAATLPLRTGAAEAAVELPPMLIEETASLPPWLYAHVGGSEYLARCTEKTARGYAEMRRDRLVWLHSVFPADMFGRMDAPSINLLVSQRYKPSSSAEIIDEVMDARRRRDGGYVRATTAPNMMLNDTDIVGVFAYIDEGSFRRDQLTLSSDFVQFMLEQRTPRLPAWLSEGILGTYNAIDFNAPAITLRRTTWPSLTELIGAASVRGGLSTPPLTRLRAEETEEAPRSILVTTVIDRPRVLLSAAELFSREAWGTQPQLMRAQATLFVRWALDPRNGMREKFWAFARRACEEPVTEALVESCLGFGYADLRDRLSDYLPLATKDPLQLSLDKTIPVPAVQLRPATPQEVARLRGEWERLSIPLVQRRYPEHVERYRLQAQRTLRRAYDTGERDPGVVASLALCELDAGGDVFARPLLERAAAAGVVRPRVYYELARLRWAGLLHGAEGPQEFEPDEIAPVLQPLRAGFRQEPLSSGAVDIFADACLRSKSTPSSEDLAELVRLGRVFVTEPIVCLRIARALGRHGRTEQAVQVLSAGFPHVPDDAMRRQFSQAYLALTKRP